jgi:hypothetical protein
MRRRTLGLANNPLTRVGARSMQLNTRLSVVPSGSVPVVPTAAAA